MELMTMSDRDWQEVSPFVDTLCIPVSGIRIQQKQIFVQQSRLLERVATSLEKKLKGRILLLPTISYIGQNHEVFMAYFNEIIKEIKDSGFYHLVIVSTESLSVCDPSQQIKVLTHQVNLEDTATDEQLEQAVHLLFQDVLQMWQNDPNIDS
ncbi:DUF2487 family protein [Hazenella coriacea]|uniref:Uncharacterized protein DUF2487 n=1 Tax=Hazenella coriacea TaxID=1179467 RepID=A0A4V6NZ77_9BACL|nr:DUF2487 family protein [Hazenella coriacea]TCS93377.1 uncharacterized protein DUF2487 [Hazenella coriacea]